MNKKLTLILLVFFNILFILLSLEWFKEINEREQNLSELALVNSELIDNINKNGLMKNCELFKDSIVLINPNIFKEAMDINSINILIDKNKYLFCYSKDSKNKLNKSVDVHRYYNVDKKNEYLFLKEVIENETCSIFKRFKRRINFILH